MAAVTICSDFGGQENQKHGSKLKKQMPVPHTQPSGSHQGSLGTCTECHGTHVDPHPSHTPHTTCMFQYNQTRSQLMIKNNGFIQQTKITPSQVHSTPSTISRTEKIILFFNWKKRTKLFGCTHYLAYMLSRHLKQTYKIDFQKFSGKKNQCNKC